MIDAVLLSVLVVVLVALSSYTAILTRRTRKDMQSLEQNTNSKMDAMLALTAKSSRAEGQKAGLEEGRNETRRS
jgi:peptidoglycan hydrolase CwlO-like protein